MTGITLIDAAGSTRTVALRAAPAFTKPRAGLRSREALAAAHVVPKAWADNVPGAPAEIDWDATLAFRRHLWSWGLGVADAMDTAQRNMGLDPAATRELIERSTAEAAAAGGRIVVGVNTDHVAEETVPLDAVADAYLSRLHHAEDVGAGVVLMASRHLARAAAGPGDYRRVYGTVLARAGAPVILHWLGEAFDPQLAGYFGSSDTAVAADTLMAIVAENPDRIAGVKMSLLDAEAEIALRTRLPAGVKMYTGDDYNYVRLIAGADGADEPGTFSHALLGAFAAIAPNASAAIQALDAGDRQRYTDILGPTEHLARQVFAAPTFSYKAGIAFLSWLNGHQPAFAMVGGLHAARSLPHLSEIVRLANEAGALERPEAATDRWHRLLELNGIDV